jgi:Tfp pilus assembly protein PilN
MKIPRPTLTALKVGGRWETALLHGPLIERLAPSPSHHHLDWSEFQQKFGRKPLYLLLASPFVRTFIQKTIPLKSKTLPLVDEQTLGIKTTTTNDRIVESIRLDPSTALTIHSHLTPAGRERLQQLVQARIRVAWRPAVAALIPGLLDAAERDLSTGDIVKLYLAQEMLEVHKHPRFAIVRHFPYLQPDRPLSESKSTIDHIIEDAEGLKPSRDYSFSFAELESTHPAGPFLAEIIAVRPQRRKIRRFTHTGSPPFQRLRKWLNRNILAGATLTCLTIWALALHFQEQKFRQQRLEWQRTTMQLQDASQKLQGYSIEQQRYFEFSAMITALAPLKIHPDKLLERIETLLPDTVWIQRIAIDHRRVHLLLLDAGETELTTLIESLSQHLGKTSLEKSDRIRIEERPLRQYSLQIDPVLHQSFLETGNPLEPTLTAVRHIIESKPAETIP